jgi:hypothetical protein
MFYDYLLPSFIVGALFLALVPLNRLLQWRSPTVAWRWLSRMELTLGLGVWFLAGEQLTYPNAFEVWSFLEYAALLLAICFGIFFVFYLARTMRRGTGTPK